MSRDAFEGWSAGDGLPSGLIGTRASDYENIQAERKEKIGTQWVHESTLHVFCKLCICSWVSLSGLETVGKILGVEELLYFQTDLCDESLNILMHGVT